MRRNGKCKRFVLLLVLTLALTGCSPAATDSAPTGPPATAAPEVSPVEAPEVTPVETPEVSHVRVTKDFPDGAAPDSSESRPVRSVTTAITLADNNISIKGPGARAQGSTLTITADGIYELTGTLTNGQVIIEAPDAAKVELVLSGVDISAGENAAIYCRNADDLIITLTEGTHNTLTDSGKFSFADAVNEEPNAALFSTCDLNIGGKGWLAVNASFRHGISTKDDLVIEGGGYMIAATMDAIRGTDSVTVRNGSFDLTAGGDGFQASSADDPAKGWALFEGGSYNIHACSDGVQAETELTITGGDFDIVTDGEPAGESDSQKGLKAANILTVEDGTFRIISKDDAVHADVDTVINGGTFYIETGDDGIHANRNLYINGGVIDIPDCYEGFEGTVIEVNGGKSFINASNDAVSAAAGTPEAEAGGNRGGNPYVYAVFNGGELEAVSGGDTVDSNGNIYVRGGTLRLSSPPKPSYEGALLCNGDVTISGGSVALVGNMGVNVYCEEQPVLWVSHVEEQAMGSTVSLRDQAGNILLEVTARKAYVQSAFTSPELQIGSTYGVYIDGVKKLDVTLTDVMNTTGDDGGRFTGGYHRGTW